MVGNFRNICRNSAAVGGVLIAFAAASGAVAQSSGPNYWVQERQQEDLRRDQNYRQHFQVVRPAHAAPNYKGYYSRHFVRPAPAAPAPVLPVNAANDAASQTPLPIPDYFVAVMGNGISLPLAQGLTATFAATHPDIAFQKDGKPLSGLVRADFYDWAKSATAILSAQPPVNLGIMMVGSNDHQPLLDGTTYLPPLTPRWSEIYGQRVNAIASLFQQKHIPLIWVGLPIVRSQPLSSAYLAFNEIYRAQAAKTGATYIDLWDAFLSDAGAYEASGPDVNGEIVKLRMFDGIHFTPAGARKIAHFLEAAIRQEYEKSHPSGPPTLTSLLPMPAPGAEITPTDADIANIPMNAMTAPPPPAADLGALIRLEMETQPSNADGPKSDLIRRLQAALPLPPQVPAPSIKIQPAMGTVRLLQPTEFGKDGDLLDQTHGSKNDAKVRATLASGVLPDADPGRANSFAWPPR